MQQIGQMMEKQVLMTMPARMSRAEDADKYIKGIYSHVTGIFDAVMKLKSITSQTDVQTIARVEKKISSIAKVMHNIQCAEWGEPGRLTRVGPKPAQIGPKWYKSRDFFLSHIFIN